MKRLFSAEGCKPKRRGHRKLTVVSILILLPLLLLLPGLYNKLTVVRYTAATNKLNAPVRVVLITDLHSCKYGDAESELVSAIDEQHPDLIMLGGDIFDDKLTDDNARALLSAIGDKYPCYYVTGNHEYWSGTDAFTKKMAILAQCGVTRLADEAITVTVNRQRINLCGADDPDGHLAGEGAVAWLENVSAMASVAQNGFFTVLLTHRPEYARHYSDCGYDLILAGHAHGGQWRIPGILNGLFAPDQGLFPEYAGGKYEFEHNTMIVSRGLSRESTRVPRLYNRPELVVVDILPAS